MQKLRFRIAGFALLACSLTSAQMTIDARNAVFNRAHEPTSATVGSVGKVLPLSVALAKAASQENATLSLTFVLTNTSDHTLEIPIGTNIQEFEPTSIHTPYTVQHLHISATTKNAYCTGAARADLYGDGANHSSMYALTPNSSISILSRTTVQCRRPLSTSEPLVMSVTALVGKEFVSLKGDDLSETVEVVGSVTPRLVRVGNPPK